MSTHPTLGNRAVTVPALRELKARGERIVALTAYDYTSARLGEESGADLLLVGDSLGMVIQGHGDTLRVTLDQMVYHCAIVSRACRRALVVADMPYMTFHTGPRDAVRNAGRCLKEGGVQGVKVEGGRKRARLVRHLVENEIPVMGHIGLTPQSVHGLGGYKVQGRSATGAQELLQDAAALEEAGAFAVVLECIPAEVSLEITRRLSVPTIGIGAGPGCDGQVLVFHDLLGLYNERAPRFVRRYGEFGKAMGEALRVFGEDVRSGGFPSSAESFHLDEGSLAAFEEEVRRGLPEGDAVEICRTIASVRSLARAWKRDGLRVVFVPTMGALHEGHASLVRLARRRGDRVVASIFVNPTQFGPGEDFGRYPRDEAGDLAACEAAGAHAVFLPAAKDMYPPGSSTFVTVEGTVAAGLCGASRPGHFRGVATVVCKLFHIVEPDAAVFGQKDAQQLAVIRRMVRDLDMAVEIVSAPTVREPDGLALSSRNTFLNPEERRQAAVLSRALRAVEARVAGGETDAGALKEALARTVATASLAELDYAEVVDAETLEGLEVLERPALAALAVRFGSTRLIDNAPLTPAPVRRAEVTPCS